MKAIELFGGPVWDNRNPAAMLFYPANILLDRLSFYKKFGMIGLIALIAVCASLYSFYLSQHQVVARAQRELEGISLIQPLAKCVQLLQQHRGLSAGVLGGIGELEAARSAKEQEIQAAFTTLDARLPASLRRLEPWVLISGRWRIIRTDGPQWTRMASFAAHTQLIDDLRQYTATLNDEYGLTASADPATFYLAHAASGELLDALEQLGKLRAMGVSILAEKQMSEQQKVQLAILLELLAQARQPLKLGIENVVRYTPDLTDTLLTTYSNFENSARQVSATVRMGLLSEKFVAAPPDYFSVTTEYIDEGYNQLYHVMLPTAHRLVNERIQKAQADMHVTLGFAFVLMLLAAYGLTAIYFTTLHSIQALSQSVRGFVQGDLRDRTHLATHDEFAQLGDSFNTMADEIAELVEAQQEAARYSRSLLEASLDPLVTINAEGGITDVNAATERVTGVPRERLIGSDFTNYFTAPDKAREVYQQVFAQGLVVDYPLAIRHATGGIVDVLYNASLYRNAAGAVLGVFATARDITERKRMEDQVRQLAFYDTLTKLPNRRLLDDRMSQARAAGARTGRYSALMFLDLDNFKPLNDRHGHAIGDLLLIEAANRLTRCVREADTVARFGGDEFVVLLTGLSEVKADATEQARLVAEKIRVRLADTYLLGSHREKAPGTEIEHHCTASIGVVVFSHHDESQADVQKWADAAMYQAKAAGRNSIWVYASDELSPS